MNLVPDVLILILTKLDDESLCKLVLVPDLWFEIRKLLDQPIYWQLRVENLLARQLAYIPASCSDWKEVRERVQGVS